MKDRILDPTLDTGEQGHGGGGGGNWQNLNKFCGLVNNFVPMLLLALGNYGHVS